MGKFIGLGIRVEALRLGFKVSAPMRGMCQAASRLGQSGPSSQILGPGALSARVERAGGTKLRSPRPDPFHRGGGGMITRGPSTTSGDLST